MKKISSSTKFVMKKLFPIIWFGFLALFMVLVISTEFKSVQKEPVG